MLVGLHSPPYRYKKKQRESKRSCDRRTNKHSGCRCMRLAAVVTRALAKSLQPARLGKTCPRTACTLISKIQLTTMGCVYACSRACFVAPLLTIRLVSLCRRFSRRHRAPSQQPDGVARGKQSDLSSMFKNGKASASSSAGKSKEATQNGHADEEMKNGAGESIECRQRTCCFPL